MTLPEVMIALTLMAAIVPILGPLMISSMRSANEIRVQSEIVDELRQESTAIARELRSAECIYEPAIPEGQVQQIGSRLRFTTNTNSQHYEVTYEVLDGKLIRTRDGTQRVISEGIVNSGDVFAHKATPRRNIDLRFVVQLGDRKAQEVTTSIAGRNAWQSLSC